MEHFYKDIVGFAELHGHGEIIKYFIENYKFDNKVKICEVGVFRGRGTSIFNVELFNNDIEYDYYAIDHFLGSSEHQGKTLPSLDIAKKHLEEFSDKITFISKESTVASFDFEDSYFDFIYVDASHDYSSVIHDIEHWFPKLKKDGIMAGDDYTRGKQWNGVELAVNKFFGEENITLINNQWVVRK